MSVTSETTSALAVNRPEIRVDLRGLGVVVAGCGVDVPLDAVGLLPDHETELRVRLQIREPVDDVDPVRLQPLGPEDVVPLVEPRLELHQHRHLLAAFGRLNQERDERASSARSGTASS